ncbi:MAG TPA: FAD:protein FMN transferase, partial [Solirubrobacteraceae bacterium]|nr:FAD:protein FMN transferase [Solirubrobacteraceae bacterium]
MMMMMMMQTRRPSPSPSPSSPSSLPPVRDGLVSARWEALGTSVVLRLTDSGALEVARETVERELDAIDRACSRFRADSELSRVNSRAGRSVVVVSPLLIEAVEMALSAAELTGGDVDPTVGAALELAGYDRDWRQLVPPLDGEPEPGEPEPRPAITARVRAGWRTVT